MSFKNKLAVIVGTSTAGLLALIIANAFVGNSMSMTITEIRDKFVPLSELEPRLTNKFERIHRALQDAVSAQDKEALSQAKELKDEFIVDLLGAREVVPPEAIEEITKAAEEYFAIASNASKRMIASETGLEIVDLIRTMQTKRATVESLLKNSVRLDRDKLSEAFSTIDRRQKTSSQIQFAVGSLCIAAVILLSIWIGRNVLGNLREISAGLSRFGMGEFKEPIKVRSGDELGELGSNANQMAERIQGLMRELESFSYSVAHDLRAPLRSMAGFSNVLLEDHASHLPEDGKLVVSRIVAASNRMALLIESLLKLSRVGRQKITKERVDISNLASRIIKDLESNAGDRQVQVKIESDLVVDGDPQLLSVVLTNLISNSWKFTGKCTNAQIEFGSSIESGQRVYFVKDNGAGFDMQYSNKLFGTFQRLHSADQFEGTGIGLAMVKNIIERHGGRIWATGEVGKGATFSFTLG